MGNYGDVIVCNAGADWRAYSRRRYPVTWVAGIYVPAKFDRSVGF